MKNIKSVIITTIILTVICAVSAAGLAGTNALTKGRIAKAEKLAEQKAMSRIIEAENYTEATVTVNGVENIYYIAKDENTYGYIFTSSHNGYGGPVKVMTGIDLDGKVIAIEVLSASDETPGLGQNVAKKTYWEKFKGLSQKVSVGNGGNVDAVTGATFSSKAVAECVNDALDMYKAIVKEGDNNG